MIPTKILRSFNLFLIYLFFLIVGCTSIGTNNTSSKKNTKEITELKQMVLQQQELLEHLQKLAADQIIVSNEMDQSMPPKDLLESLQNGFIEIRENMGALDERIREIENDLKVAELQMKQIPKIDTKHFDTIRKQENIILGLISIQAGNPDKALVYLQEILQGNYKYTLKAQILMALGNGFLEQGHATQAAYYYGIILREHNKSPHVPNALYYLGKAMEELEETEKQKVLWNELFKNHPESPLTKRAKKRLID